MTIIYVLTHKGVPDVRRRPMYLVQYIQCRGESLHHHINCTMFIAILYFLMLFTRVQYIDYCCNWLGLCRPTAVLVDRVSLMVIFAFTVMTLGLSSYLCIWCYVSQLATLYGTYSSEIQPAGMMFIAFMLAMFFKYVKYVDCQCSWCYKSGARCPYGGILPLVVGNLPQRWGKTPTLGPHIFNVFLQTYDYTSK
jgi:hypothetical protein